MVYKFGLRLVDKSEPRIPEIRGRWLSEQPWTSSYPDYIDLPSYSVYPTESRLPGYRARDPPPSITQTSVTLPSFPDSPHLSRQMLPPSYPDKYDLKANLGKCIPSYSGKCVTPSYPYK
jgi:hypothetical protein